METLKSWLKIIKNHVVERNRGKEPPQPTVPGEQALALVEWSECT